MLENGRYGYENEDGEIVIKTKYGYASKFKDGLVCVKIDEDNIACINKKEEIVIGSIKGISGSTFEESLAIFRNLDGKYGAIDTNGNVIINPVYEEMNDFSEGFAVVKLNRRYGYIDTNGDIVVKNE